MKSFLNKIKEYISTYKESKKANKILDNVNGYKLDQEQRKVVLNNSDVCLVIAGAGSGKTLTMIGKIKYLLAIKKINPKKILVLSFTNFTTTSFQNNLLKNNITNIDVLTFHKLGLKILKQANYKFRISSPNLLSNIIKNYFEKELLKNREYLSLFLHNYIINNNNQLQNNQVITSDEEIIISNFLYCNNIKYIYKPIEIEPNRIDYAFYLIEYDIYIKHINLSELIDNAHLFENKKYPPNYIVTNSYLFTYDDIFKYLYHEFKCKGIKINDQNYFEISNIFILKSNIIQNLYNLIITFINIMKTNNISINKINEIKKTIEKKYSGLEKNKLLFTLSLIEIIYIKYEATLNQNKEIDFNDMINISSKLVKQGKIILNYDYIIIDEYQDTSYSRYNLIKEIIEKTKAKLLAVGDDFQSIYRFTGCNIAMFLNFKKYFPNSKIMYITSTYRNSNSLIRVAGTFIMKNKYQISKKLKSHQELSKPIKIYFYQHKDEITNLFQIIKENSLFVLGRNNKDINYINTLKTDKKVTFMSIHKSKGLESEGVVIVNLCNQSDGFPNKCKENILIKYLCSYKEYYPYEEERRLFYVALTRTKNNVYLFVPRNNMSLFVKEIVNECQKDIEIIN